MTPEQMKEAQEAIANAIRTGGMTVIDVPEFDPGESPGIVVDYDGNDLWLVVDLL